MTPSKQLIAARKELKKENAKWPRTLSLVPPAYWLDWLDELDCGGRNSEPRFAVWRSKDWLVQGMRSKSPDVICVLAVCRAAIDDRGQWVDGVTWDELMEIKRQAGFANNDAVEVYPPDFDVVNVANFRWLWVMRTPLTFAWRKGEPS